MNTGIALEPGTVYVRFVIFNVVEEASTIGSAVTVAPLDTKEMFCGIPLTSTGFVMFVFKLMNRLAITTLPGVPPVQVMTKSPTFSANPVAETATAVVFAVVH